MELDIRDQPSTSGHNLSSSSILDISVKEVLPPPQAIAISADKRNYRRRGKTGHLNSTPEIYELKEKVIEKEMKIRKQQGRAVKRQLVIANNDDNSDEDESALEEFLGREKDDSDASCLYCNELYSQSRAREKWIRCQICRSWCHNECADVSYRCKTFICELCS